MDLKDISVNIIEEIYNTGMFAEDEIGTKYKELQHTYNELFDSIENEELKEKFEKLETLKNEMYSENNKDIFKLGVSIGVKFIIEALNYK